ncbi:MAG TPA: VWA domain-containing protein [Chloroflexota bacterium]|jgi:VWFA-related protein
MRRIGRSVTFTPVLLAFGLLLSSASQTAAQGAPTHVVVGQPDASRFPEIQATVVVSDRVGLPVTGLNASDFAVLADGRTATLESAEPVKTLPADFAVNLVIDTSGSMKGQPLADASDAINGFIDSLDPVAKVGGVSLGGNCLVDPGQGLSTDHAAAKEFFASAVAGGDTPLYDATLVAIQQSLVAPEGRRLVVVLTDGEDTCSKVSLDTVIQAAVHNGVPLIFIGLGPDLRADILQSTATLTGGTYLSAQDSGQLATIYADLTDRLKTQYSLRFRSGLFADQQEHVLSVRVTGGGVDAGGETRFTPPAVSPDLRLSVDPNQQINRATRVEVTTTSPVQLQRADVYLDGVLVHTLANPPLVYTLDPSGLSEGPHTLQVHVWDSAGGESDTSVALNFVATGVLGGIPSWMVLAIVLLLPLLLLVGVFVVHGRRSLRCPKCRRELRAGWAACPYCTAPQPGHLLAKEQ